MRCVLEGVRNAAASSVWLLAAAHRHNKQAGSLSAGRVSYCVEKKLTVSSHSAASQLQHTRRPARRPNGNDDCFTKFSCTHGNSLKALYYYSAK